MPDSAASPVLIRATGFEGALRPRVVGRAETVPGPSWLAVLIEEGWGEVQEGDQITRLSAPVLAWRPWNDRCRLSLSPGAVGVYLLCGAPVVANAIGRTPESRDLRDMIERTMTVALNRTDRTYLGVRPCFTAIQREVQTATSSSRTLIESYLRVVLVELLRAQPTLADRAERTPPQQRIFNRFAGMVELQFRNRWTVNQYATTLGVSRDRLGDICRRVRGLGPKDLIDRRVALEARILLESSSNSIDQIAGQLGFASAAQFSRFFYRTAGQPPGQYRKDMTLQMAETSIQEPSALHEWP